MYRRKYDTQEQRSAALSRAAQSRKVCRGGHPKGWRKDASAGPLVTLSVRRRDAAVFKGLAAERKSTVVDLAHLIARMITGGGSFKPHPELAPTADGQGDGQG